MAPRQFCSRLLQHFLGRLERAPSASELAHIPKATEREAGDIGQLAPKIDRQSIDDLGAPPLSILTIEDLLTDFPVQLDQLAVDGEHGTSPGSPDPGLDLGEELRVVGRQPG
jgi:hypothetical protein